MVGANYVDSDSDFQQGNGLSWVIFDLKHS